MSDQHRTSTIMPADMPWLDQYEEAVPKTMEFPSHTLQKFLEDTAAKHPNQTALVMKGKKLTYQEINEAADHVAAALHALGFKQGDRAVVYMANCPQSIITYYGILKAGGIVIATNPLYTERELRHQLEDCGAETIFVMSMFYDKLKAVQATTNIKRIIVTNIKEYFPAHLKFLFTMLKEKKDGHRADVAPEDMLYQNFLALGAKSPQPNVTTSGDDIALLQYTGGTTGLSKGAIATHNAMVSNVYVMQAWMYRWTEGEEIVLTSLPLFHSYGMVTAMHFGISIAANLILIPNPRDQKDVLGSIEKYKVTIFPGVPAMYNAINNNPDVAAGKYDLSSVASCLSGSAPLLRETRVRFEQLTGGNLVEGYGMTEAHVATHGNRIYASNPDGSVGLPLPGVECRIREASDPSIEKSANEIGELWIKTPSLMSGYWNLEEKTRETIVDGWYATGDIVEMDEEGYFYIRDRVKDMILAGGYNIYPRELEEVYATHPDVVEAAVVGIPHPHRGEEAIAFIVLQEGATISEEEFVEWGKQQFAAYKYPRKVRFISELPKSTVGKTLKRVLRDMV